jgi:hypothetical protein
MRRVQQSLDATAVSKFALDTILARLDALETAMHGQPRKRMSKADVAHQERCHPRTVMRKVGDGSLPPPDDVVNGRLFWWSDSIERYRKRGPPDTPAARAARNPRLRKPALTSPRT